MPDTRGLLYNIMYIFIYSYMWKKCKPSCVTLLVPHAMALPQQTTAKPCWQIAPKAYLVNTESLSISPIPALKAL